MSADTLRMLDVGEPSSDEVMLRVVSPSLSAKLNNGSTFRISGSSTLLCAGEDGLRWSGMVIKVFECCCATVTFQNSENSNGIEVCQGANSLRAR